MSKLSRSAHALILMSAFALAGCSNRPAPVSVTPPAPPPVKAMLEEVANSGQLGSGAESIRTALEGMKATDSAKAEALLNDLAALEKMTGEAKIKAKAKEMAGKL
jgi:hypothetical protein